MPRLHCFIVWLSHISKPARFFSRKCLDSFATIFKEPVEMFRKLFLSRTWHKSKLDRLSHLHQAIRTSIFCVSQAANWLRNFQQQSLQTWACLFMWKNVDAFVWWNHSFLLGTQRSNDKASLVTPWEHFIFQYYKRKNLTEDLLHIHKFNAFNPSTNVYLFFCSACNKWIKIKYNLTWYFFAVTWGPFSKFSWSWKFGCVKILDTR